jgi:hypothetical protein
MRITFSVIVRRSACLTVVQPNKSTVRQITGFTGRRLFVTADTVDGDHTSTLYNEHASKNEEHVDAITA